MLETEAPFLLPGADSRQVAEFLVPSVQHSKEEAGREALLPGRTLRLFSLTWLLLIFFFKLLKAECLLGLMYPKILVTTPAGTSLP